MSISTMDIILAVPMVWLGYRGWRNGIVREVATLIGIAAGIWAATHLSGEVVEAIGLEGESAVLIAFFLCFAGGLAVAYIAGRVVERLMKTAHIGMANRIAGAALGMAKAVCILAVIIGYLAMLDTKGTILKQEKIEKSILFKPVYETGNKMTAAVKDYIANHKEEWKEALI